MKKMILGFCVLALAVASAQGRHPRYLKARTDLRAAQLFMRVHDEPNVMHRLREADAEIDMAISEIDRAAVIDHKDYNERPPIDANLDRPGRFRKAMSLLISARHDIGAEEDNPRAIAWRDAAYRHIDAAMDFLRKAARDLRIDHLESYR